MSGPIYLWSSYKNKSIIKKAIRSNVTKLTLNEMRRLKGPIYDAVIEELMQEGCVVSAHYIGLFARIEDRLIEQQAFSLRVCDAPALLPAIVDNIKIAEKNQLLSDDKEKSLRALLQTAHIIDMRGAQFSWLAGEFYGVVNEFMDWWQGNYDEVKSRIFYMYGKFLAEMVHDLPLAIEKLRLGLKMCKGTTWTTNENSPTYLHQDMAVLLCNSLLKQAKKESLHNPELSIEYTKEVGIIIAEDGISSNKVLYCEASIRRCEYLLILRRYEHGVKVLERVQTHMMMAGTTEQQCLYFMQMGICRYFLKDFSLALRKLKKSLRLSQIYANNETMAQALFYIGKIHSKREDGREEAKETFIQARDIFGQLNDVENVKKANYLLGLLDADRLLPSFIKTMKNADTDFCSMVHLRRWRDQNRPFWKYDGGKEQNDPIVLSEGGVGDVYCLMED